MDIMENLSNMHYKFLRENFKTLLLNSNSDIAYKYVPFELLSWNEVKEYLSQLKPVLQTDGIEFNEDKLEEEFEMSKLEYIIDEHVYSRNTLIYKLSRMIDLEDEDKKLLTEIADQFEANIGLKSREDIAYDLIKSKNVQLDKMYDVYAYDGPDNPIYLCLSSREILLSKAIGIPWPSFVINGFTDTYHDRYDSNITPAKFKFIDITANIKSLKDKAKSIKGSGKKGRLEFGFDNNAYDKLEGGIIVTDKELLTAGLDPENVNWNEISRKTIRKLKKNFNQTLKKCKGSMMITYYKQAVEIAEHTYKQAKLDYKEHRITPLQLLKQALNITTTSKANEANNMEINLEITKEEEKNN